MFLIVVFQFIAAYEYLRMSCKIPNISPGLIDIFKHIFEGLYFEGLYLGGILCYYLIVKTLKSIVMSVKSLE